MSEYTDYSLVVHPLNHGGAAKNDTTLAILQDLIAELRAAHRPAADLDGELRLCTEGCGITPCLTLRYADRAEQRLQHTEQ